jgi:hypothetical protein
MRHPIQKFYEFLAQPIFFPARVMLVMLSIPLVLSFTEPLWRIDLSAPQYPKGLWMEIYSYQVTSGDDGQHMQEINTLNHYIGMSPIDRAALSDLDWLPFAIGALVLLTLRCAVVGDVRSLLDLLVVTAYVSAFGMGRFAYKLYVFGHNLDPRAPVKVEPFTPAILGTKKIANFTTTSLPQGGSYLLGAFATGLFFIVVWHLWAGRRRAARAEHATTVENPGAPV